MSVKSDELTTYTVRDIDPYSVQLIREMATRFRVRHARIVEEAVRNIEWMWATHTGLPEDFSKPRDW